jgi:hypothetical protein
MRNTGLRNFLSNNQEGYVVVRKKAIVIPFNPHLNFLGGSAVGSLIAHKWFADKNGAVFWDLIHVSPHPEIKTAYFYDNSEKAVTYKSKVDYIRRKEDIDKKDEKYIPNWRRVSWDREQDSGQVWLKLRNIYPLKRKSRLFDFIKMDRTNLERVQNCAIVMDRNLKVNREKVSVNETIDDYIYRLTTQINEKLKEKDIEEILWYLMLEKNLTFVDRQIGRDRRIDVAFKNNKGDYIVIEIKRGTADIYTLNQIKDYMKRIMTKEDTDRVVGIILCRKADLELVDAVRDEKNIFIDEYQFSMRFPKIGERLDSHD